MIPWVIYLYTSGQQPLSFLIVGFGAAILAPLALIGFTKTFNKMVGVISMTESKEFVRIGFLSFYGSRRNMIFPVEDIVPLTDVYSPENQEKILKLSKFSDPEDYLYLSAKGVQILDEEKAKLLFGNLKFFKTIKDQKVKEE